MSVLLIALPIALLLGALAVHAFIRAVRQGQFDDLETPPLRILHDELEGDRVASAPALPYSRTPVVPGAARKGA